MSGRKVGGGGGVTEDELLQRRLAHAQWLAGMLAQPTSLAALTVAAYTDLVDDLLLDVAVEVHREHKTGLAAAAAAAAAAAGGGGGGHDSGAHLAHPHPLPRPVPLDPLPGVKAPTDLFGQVHPGTATDVVVCRNCGRKAQAGKFAYHLEKCLGKGRAGERARQTSRRTGA